MYLFEYTLNFFNLHAFWTQMIAEKLPRIKVSVNHFYDNFKKGPMEFS